MKLKDIRKNIKTSVDVSDSSNQSQYKLIGKGAESFKDIDMGKKSVNLGGNNKILVEKQTKKSIDPLGKKTLNSKKISLKSKKNIDFGYFFKSYIQKKIKKQSKLQKSKKQDAIRTFGNIYFISFLCISLLLGIFLYKDLLEKYLSYSYETLSYVKDDFPDYDAINEDIGEAKNGFLITEYLFKPISFINTQSVVDAERLIVGGKYLTSGFEKASRIGFDILLLTNQKDISQILFSHFFNNSRENYHGAISDMRQAYTFYESIGDLGEEDLNKKLAYLKKNLSTFLQVGEYVDKNYDILLNILGHSKRKKYMIVFQNSDEIRPQGGFMGSVGFVEIFGGKVQKFEKKDIYALEWEINKNPFREPAPEGIDRITGTFGLRDANYFIGTKSSSYKIREILKRGNIEIDGIIYTNINIAKDILNAIGGIESEVLGMKVTGDNFPILMSSLVESKQSKKGTLDSPKDVLFQFIDELITELKTQKDTKLYAKILGNAILSRDLFFYAFDEKSEEFLDHTHLNGKIRYENHLDFNYPVFTSISGNKSDRYVERSYSKYVTMFDNCIVSTRLNVKLRHNFSLADERDAIDIFNTHGIDIEENLAIQGLGNNKQYVRIVLPKDSIIKNNNVVVKNYPNTRVVEFYMDTERFESSYFVLNYLLPNTECREYDFQFYKQPGIYNYNFEFYSKKENMKFTGIREDFEYKLQ